MSVASGLGAGGLVCAGAGEAIHAAARAARVHVEAALLRMVVVSLLNVIVCRAEGTDGSKIATGD